MFIILDLFVTISLFLSAMIIGHQLIANPNQQMVVCCCADAVTTPPAPCGISPIPLDSEMNETITAQLGQVVWHVAVESKGLIGGVWKISCGGAVITPQAVLTAASCVDGQFSGMNRAEAGIIELPKGGFFKKGAGQSEPTQAFIESVKVHPNFDKKTLANNLAVLRLAMPFDFAKTDGNISNICMPNVPVNHVESDEKLFISGWGAGIDGTILRKKLQIQPVQIVDCPADQPRNKNEFCVSQEIDQMTETGTMSEQQCEGDIGGPLFTSNTDAKGSILLGIASHCTNCTTDNPMIFTDVFPYLQWIHDSSKPHY
ncbi:Transmembrane protease serine 2 [Dermatophagoides farinae]|uniref:Transmembrane protease serine 2 n=1 Tax=Dermatophagoides farinae TaxID=6954 RepID=A0A922HT39_DERFA|nr:Transmembrane protease serine 2 [Dermatophagoides farinae]